jgi:hypothetical protein
MRFMTGFLIVSSLALSGCSREPPRPEYLDGLKAYACQIHLHGLTNHNGSEMPASMQWHSYYASRSGIDIIWWTDHCHGLDLTEDADFNLQDGDLDPGTFEITGLGDIRRSITSLQPTITGGHPAARMEDGRLTLRLQSQNRDSADRFLYYAASDWGKVHSTQWIRPVSSGLEFRGELAVARLDDAASIEVEAHLSWHFREEARQDTLVFHLRSSSSLEHATVLSDHLVLVEAPLPEGWRSGAPVPI